MLALTLKPLKSIALLVAATIFTSASFALDGDLSVASLESARSLSRPGTRLNPDGARTGIQSPISPDQYRVRVAEHIYKLNTDKVFQGRMPPLLKAIGVVEIQLNATGDIKNLKWNRAPLQAPEVMQEIERTLRSAAPFPVSAKAESVVFTETWLWHKSGRFQLLSLTEGQD